MRILVTGAQGCIGAWIVKLLLERGMDVLVYDLDPHPSRLSMIASSELVRKLAVETGAIEDTERIVKLIRDQAITHIIHLAAALMPYCHQYPVQGGLTNVIGTLNVFEAARKAARGIRVVYASSSAVWGPKDQYGEEPLSEKNALKPTTHYGIFKQANEGSARVFYETDGISSIALRPWTVYGIGRDRGLTAGPTIAAKAVALRKPFQIRLSGFMDLQYVEDVADAFLRCLFSELEGAHVFNLAGEVVSMDDLIQTLERLRPGAMNLVSAKGPQVPVAYRMDDSALRALVPGIRKTSLKDGLEKTLTLFEKLDREGRLAPELE
jgi:nucleoside-diphosphate-sugar epimerase